VCLRRRARQGGCGTAVLVIFGVDLWRELIPRGRAHGPRTRTDCGSGRDGFFSQHRHHEHTGAPRFSVLLSIFAPGRDQLPGSILERSAAAVPVHGDSTNLLSHYITFILQGCTVSGGARPGAAVMMLQAPRAAALTSASARASSCRPCGDCAESAVDSASARLRREAGHCQP